MTQLQYSALWAKITSLEGTKRPLQELIKEIYKLTNIPNTIRINTTDEAVEDYLKGYKLITYAAAISTAKAPMTIEISNKVESLQTSLYLATDIDFNETYKYANDYSSTPLTFDINSLSRLNILDNNLINSPTSVQFEVKLPSNMFTKSYEGVYLNQRIAAEYIKVKHNGNISNNQLYNKLMKCSNTGIQKNTYDKLSEMVDVAKAIQGVLECPTTIIKN